MAIIDAESEPEAEQKYFAYMAEKFGVPVAELNMQPRVYTLYKPE